MGSKWFSEVYGAQNLSSSRSSRTKKAFVPRKSHPTKLYPFLLPSISKDFRLAPKYEVAMTDSLALVGLYSTIHGTDGPRSALYSITTTRGVYRDSKASHTQ